VYVFCNGQELNFIKRRDVVGMEAFDGDGLLLAIYSMLQILFHITPRQLVVAVSVWVGTTCSLYSSSSGSRWELQIRGVLFGHALE
jgi:hypothetical protein